MSETRPNVQVVVNEYVDLVKDREIYREWNGRERAKRAALLVAGRQCGNEV